MTQTPTTTATETTDTQAPAPDKQFFWGVGRRKTAVARVRVRPGRGHFLINGRHVDDYFHTEHNRRDVRAPLEVVGGGRNLDVYVNVTGGGLSGQAGAVVLGLARAIRAMDPATEDWLRERGFLTRDARMVERKKPGRRKARRSFQFSKR